MNAVKKAILEHRITTRISPAQLEHLKKMPCASTYLRMLLELDIKAANDE